MSKAGEKRRDAIFRDVVREGSVRVDMLSQELGVSEQTIRQDLARLEDLGLLTRTRGGAQAVGMGEVRLGAKEGAHVGEKARIARAALRQVGNGDVVWLDPGSTTLAFAPLLQLRREITVITNNIRAAEACGGAGIHTVLAGGVVDTRALAVLGSDALRIVESACIDVAFFGCDGFDGQEGPTMTSEGIMSVARLAIRRAKKPVLLADSSKLLRQGRYRLAACEDFSVLVTEAVPDEARWVYDRFPQVMLA